jgi:hypothetical protein
VSLLYTFLPQPNTAVYVGHGDILLSDVDPISRQPLEGLHRLRRTIFLKLSHNFRH